MIKTVTQKLKAFFEALPQGRIDQFSVSNSLIDSDSAFDICVELNLSAKFSAEKGSYTFSNLDFCERDMKVYECLIANHVTDKKVKRWAPPVTQKHLDLMDYRASMLANTEEVIHRQK